MGLEVDIEIGSVEALPISSVFEPAPTGLTAVAVAAGGTFAAGNYYWVVTGTDAYGETTASNEASAAVALNGECNLTWNALPNGTTGVKVYRGTAPGAENALIATLGAVTAYTDTGIAGGAGTPPAINTAQIGNQQLYGTECALSGYSFLEASGANPASLIIETPGNPLVYVTIPTGGTVTQSFGNGHIRARNGLLVHVNSGVFKGTVFARYPD